MIALLNQKLKTLAAKDLGIESLPLSLQEQIISRLGEILMKRATLTVADSIPKEERSRLETLMKDGDVRELEEFLRMRVKNIDSIVMEAIEKEIYSFRKKMGVVL